MTLCYLIFSPKQLEGSGYDYRGTEQRPKEKEPEYYFIFLPPLTIAARPLGSPRSLDLF